MQDTATCIGLKKDMDFQGSDLKVRRNSRLFVWLTVLVQMVSTSFTDGSYIGKSLRKTQFLSRNDFFYVATKLHVPCICRRSAHLLGLNKPE